MAKPPDVSPSFSEGRFLDLWVLIHLLTGVTGGFSNVFFGLTTAQVVGLGTVLMVIWEIGEHVQGIREHLANRVVDVVAGLIGVGIAILLNRVLEPPGEMIAFGVALGVSLIGLGFGVAARNKRLKRKRLPPKDETKK